ncbi:MAG: Clp protease N-terminal domain-containing protein, partial [Bacteroidales bacterium]
MNVKLSRSVQNAISYSREEAIRLGNEYISPDHLLLGIIREGNNIALDILKNLDVKIDELKKRVENRVKNISNELNLHNAE